MSGLSSQSLGTVWGRSLHRGLVAQIPHRGRDIFLELDSTHDVDLGQPDAAGGLYLTVASVPTASSPMSSTMTMTKSERRIRVMALVTVTSIRPARRPVRLLLPRLHIPNDQDQKQTGDSGGSVQNAKDNRQDPPAAKEVDDHLDSRQTVAISRTTSASSKRSPQLSFTGQMRAPE